MKGITVRCYEDGRWFRDEALAPPGKAGEALALCLASIAEELHKDLCDRHLAEGPLMRDLDLVVRLVRQARHLTRAIEALGPDVTSEVHAHIGLELPLHPDLDPVWVEVFVEG